MRKDKSVVCEGALLTLIAFIASCGETHQYEEVESQEKLLGPGAGPSPYNPLNNSGYLAKVQGPSSVSANCSAILIGKGVVLTAAHCVVGTRPQQATTQWSDVNYIFSRDTTISSSPVDHARSAQITLHPNAAAYSNQQWDDQLTIDQTKYDLALVALYGDLDPHFAISMPLGGYSVGTSVRLDGYGKNSTGNSGTHLTGITKISANSDGSTLGAAYYTYGSTSDTYTAAGDSGSPVFLNQQSPNTTILLAIHSGGLPNNSGVGVSLASSSSQDFLLPIKLENAARFGISSFPTVF